MKYVLCIAAFVVAVTGSAYAQKKITSGKLVMNMTVPDSIKKTKEAVDFIPNGTIIYFKDSMARTEMNTEQGTMIMLYNSKQDESIMCMDVGGKKIALRQPRSQMDALMDAMGGEKPIVKTTNEKKKVAGFKCKKAVVTRKIGDKQYTEDVWYTDQIAVPQMVVDKMEGVDGFAMESVSVKDGIPVHMQCTSFTKMTPADSLFTIPKGYEETDMNELMKGGGN